MVSLVGKIGCNPETLRGWVRQTERDQGRQPGLTSDDRSLNSSGSAGFRAKSPRPIHHHRSLCAALA